HFQNTQSHPPCVDAVRRSKPANRVLLMSHEREPAAMQELRDLIDRLLDGELSIEESQRLEQLVCSSHAASDYYLQAMQLTAGLARRPLPRLSQAEVDPSGTLQLQDELAVL